MTTATVPTPVLLDWSSRSETPGGAGDPEPCVICALNAIVRGPNGLPCHKVCAERNPHLSSRWMRVAGHSTTRRRSTRAE